MATPAVKNVRQVSAPKSAAYATVIGVPVAAAGSPVPVPTVKTSGQLSTSTPQPQTMQLQVDLGDLYIKKVSPKRDKGDEMGSGDEPAWSTFRGRLRIDGNSYGNGGFDIRQMSPIQRVGDNLGAGSVNSVPNFQKTLDWLSYGSADYALKVFDPTQIWRRNSQTPNLAADIAIGGVVYWEVDNNKTELPSKIPGVGSGIFVEESGKDVGGASRGQLVDLLLNWLGDSANEFAKSLVIPFNYTSYLKNPKGAFAQWGESFGAGLSGALKSLTGDAGSAVGGIVKNRLSDYLGGIVRDRGNVDRITGIHLMVLIPVTTEFYGNLQELKRAGKLPLDPFPNDELITSIKMFDPGARNATSTWLTFGFVPNGHPATLPGPSSEYLSGPASGFFQKPVGKDENFLSFRGGYDLFLNDGVGWGPSSEEWTAPVPGIKAGPSLWSDPSKLPLFFGEPVI